MAKRTTRLFLLALCALALAACSKAPQPPVAKIVPHELTSHGDTRIDDYYWLKERENPEVIAYLEAENAYTEAMTGDTADLQDALFAEMKGRLKEDESSAPYEKDGYWYYTRYVEGGEYPLHCRRAGSLEAPEEVMFDGNAMAAGQGYFSLRGVEVSPDTRLAVFGVDTVGRRFYTLRVKNLESGLVLADEIPDVTGNVTWAMDNKTLFYTRQDPQTLRAWQVWRHQLGTPVTADVLVYQEDDETFELRRRSIQARTAT